MAAKPILGIFDKLTKEEYMQLVLFSLAYSNRMLFRSAIAIKKELFLTKTLNSMSVRYLVLVRFCEAAKQERGIQVLRVEKGDLYRYDKRMLTSILRLDEMGLVRLYTRESGVKWVETTDLGHKAIGIIENIITETIHAYPKGHEGKNSIRRRIDKNYKSVKRIDSSDSARDL